MIITRIIAVVIILLGAAVLAGVVSGHSLSRNNQELLIVLGMIGWLGVVGATIRSRS